MANARLFIGLISGTSADAIDAALVAVSDDQIETSHTLEVAFPAALKTELDGALNAPDALTAQSLGRLDSALGDAFGAAALALLDASGQPPSAITAIGCHGQTLYHEPVAQHPFTLQVGDGARIATLTGINVVNDFRRADVANGGQGAPLAPLLHDRLFRDPQQARAVLNLGGIANLTRLSSNTPVTGFDTGPANTLMDRWAQWCGVGRYDANGELARRGTPDQALLDALLTDDYFAKPVPKSTGREHFNAAWLANQLGIHATQAPTLSSAEQANIMATLCALTAKTVADAVRAHAPDTGQLIVCGGGAANPVLLGMLGDHLTSIEVTSSNAFGIDSDFIEATLFAWLAAAHIDGVAVATQTITGSRRAAIAGTLHHAPKDTP